jgi:hypothetical protein
LIVDSADPGRVVYFLSEDLRWTLRKVIKADPERSIPHESTFVTKDKQTGIHCIDDPLVHMTYLVVRGLNVAGVTESIRQATDIIEGDAAASLMDDATTPAEKARAIACVALTAPEFFDAETFERLRRGFHDPDPDVRKTAAWGTVYPAWQELRPLLEAMRDRDPVDELRADAARLLAGFDVQATKA